MQKRKFGWLLAIVLIAAIGIFFFTKTDFFTTTRFFVQGEGNEKIQNVIDAVSEGDRFIIVNRSSEEELNHIVDAVFDSPKLFYIGMRYNALSVGDISILALRDKYPNVELKQATIEEITDKIIANYITEDMSDYDKVLAIHDWICNNVEYGAADNYSDQDIYGAFVMREARCAGYAKAFTYLLDKIGIESYVVSGESIDRDGSSIAHAWNLIYIDGQPYYFDITWDDDPAKGPTYEWFAMTYEEFRYSHFPSDGYEWVESATYTDACYYRKNNLYIEQYNANQLANIIRRCGNDFSIKCADRQVMNSVIKALGDVSEMKKIMKAANIDSIDKVVYEESAHSTCLRIIIQE